VFLNLSGWIFFCQEIIIITRLITFMYSSPALYVQVVVRKWHAQEERLVKLSEEEVICRITLYSLIYSRPHYYFVFPYLCNVCIVHHLRLYWMRWQPVLKGNIPLG
jgi:hypothetical protein